MKVPAIKVVDLLLTYNCNFGCRYCFVNQSGNKQSMKSQILEQAMSWIAQEAQDEVEIVLLGGEPTLEPLLIEQAVNIAKKYSKTKNIKFHFAMTTNFVNIDEKLAKKLKKWHIPYLISLGGYGRRHDKSRPTRSGVSSFNILKQKIKMFQKYQPNLATRVTATPNTVDWLCEDLTNIQKMGFSHLIISPATGIKWSDEKLEQFKNQMINYVKTIKIIDGKPDIIVSPINDAPKGFRQWGCGAGRGRYSIDPNGNIYSCARFAGMIKTDPLKIGDIYNGVDVNGNIKKFQDDTYVSRQECLTCPMREECLGGCPAVNWEEGGDLIRPSTNECRMLKIVFEIRASIAI